ncbi:MAG: hypothetical protein OXI11_01075 [Gammaproteobacteria bacterium]|nr:hypothetical protein [Gammaproteobacteria bacterium]
MAQGSSGRIVLEVDTELKRQLYSVLAAEGSTLKAWFVNAARRYLDQRAQPRLRFDRETIERGKRE